MTSESLEHNGIRDSRTGANVVAKATNGDVLKRAADEAEGAAADLSNIPDDDEPFNPALDPGDHTP